MARQHPRLKPALGPPTTPRAFSPRPTVSVTAADGSNAGSANGSSDVRWRLEKLDAEAEKVAELLKAARAGLRKNPSDEVLKKAVQDLKEEKADLDKRRKALEATLSVGATAGVSGAGDDGRLYSDVTLYVLSQGQKGYSTLKKQRATRKQLQGIWKESGYIFVASVDTKPAQLFTVDTCPDCTDMGSIDLKDGIQLAVVVHQPMTFMDLLQNKVTDTTNLVQELRGFKDHMVAEQENAAAAWALELIKAEPGAHIFCTKKVAKKVELDGAACSDVSVVIVERKQTFRYSDLDDYVKKLETLKMLIEVGVPNTEPLQGKELRAYAMADSWSGSEDEQATMVLLMNEHHIQPVMPDGSGYNIGWACNPHRPAFSTAEETAACAQRFLETRKREKSAQPAKLR